MEQEEACASLSSNDASGASEPRDGARWVSARCTAGNSGPHATAWSAASINQPLEGEQNAVAPAGPGAARRMAPAVGASTFFAAIDKIEHKDLADTVDVGGLRSSRARASHSNEVRVRFHGIRSRGAPLTPYLPQKCTLNTGFDRAPEHTQIPWNGRAAPTISARFAEDSSCFRCRRPTSLLRAQLSRASGKEGQSSMNQATTQQSFLFLSRRR